MRTRRAARIECGGGGLSALPDHLLELCMPSRRVGDGAWSLGNLRLVCKRWKRVFDSSPRLTGGRLVAWGDHFMGRHEAGRRVRHEWDAAALPRLAASQAAVVRQATFTDAHKPGRLEAVQQLTALTSLELWTSGAGPHSYQGTDAQLAQRQLGLGALPHLRDLSLHVANMLAPSCAQLSAARHLTSLQVDAFLHEVPSEMWDSLACLPSLAELEISVHTRADATYAINSRAWQRLAACTQLTSLKLAQGFVQGGSYDRGPFELLPGATQLASLREFTLQGSVVSLGDLWRHTGLTRLVLWDSEIPTPLPPHGGPSLPALLEADLGNVEREIDPPGYRLFSEGLCAVTCLSLRSAAPLPGEFDDAYIEQMEGLSRLTKLHTLELSGRLNSIPHTVRDLTSLKLLNVSDCDLRELPEGPYLLGLRTLLMPGHRMQRLPPALATARSLELLDAYRYNYWSRDRILLPLLQPADLSTLSAMPALRVLCLPPDHNLTQKAAEEAHGLQLADLQQHCLLLQQWMLGMTFCALLPRLVVLFKGTRSLGGMFRGGEYANGLDPSALTQLQQVMRTCWHVSGVAWHLPARLMLQRAADAGQLSPQALALLPELMADLPVVPAEPAA